jgi:hypothetical protein
MAEKTSSHPFIIYAVLATDNRDVLPGRTPEILKGLECMLALHTQKYDITIVKRDIRGVPNARNRQGDSFKGCFKNKTFLLNGS